MIKTFQDNNIRLGWLRGVVLKWMWKKKIKNLSDKISALPAAYEEPYQGDQHGGNTENDCVPTEPAAAATDDHIMRYDNLLSKPYIITYYSNNNTDSVSGAGSALNLTLLSRLWGAGEGRICYWNSWYMGVLRGRRGNYTIIKCWHWHHDYTPFWSKNIRILNRFFFVNIDRHNMN